MAPRKLPHGTVPPSSGKMSLFLSSTFWVVVLMTAIPSFFLGTVASLWIMDLEGGGGSPLDFARHNVGNIWLEGQMNQRLQHEKLKWQKEQQEHLERRLKRQQEVLLQEQEVEVQRQVQQKLKEAESNQNAAATNAKDCPALSSDPLFPTETVGHFAVGMTRTPKASLTEELDLGVPVDLPADGSSEVLLLYSRVNALPNHLQPKQKGEEEEPNMIHTTIPDVSNAKQALENCDLVNVVLTDRSGQRKQCIAIVPQYESYHLQKWMRLEDAKPSDQHAAPQKMDSHGTLQLVSRGRQTNGRDQFHPPDLTDTRKNWELLQQYLSSLDDTLEDLKSILQNIAINNTVIVMVCNFGQAELLMNFVCSAQSRGFDISNVIVFTTDQDTTDLASALGVQAYFDHRNFGDIPEEAAGRYGDRKFTAMMMAKVICVQLVSMLGYDFLFQDVDIVWFQNPLKYFQDESSPAYNFDVFFQDDGGHSVRYAPYSANSGFYFVRHNDRTRHFLTSLLMGGDLVLKTGSHQQALIATLSEHVSLYGLKAKVLSRDEEEFPGGYQFHQKSGNFMRAFFEGKVHPYIFHMSWTLNKNNKLLFFKQMGEWFVQEQCLGKKEREIIGSDGGGATVKSTCCSAEPLISCHYRDKPSKIPCKDKPPIDKGKPSFW